MRIHYLMHEPYEGLGSIEKWAYERNYPITSTQFFIDSHLPKVDDIDMLVVLGGNMNIYETEKYPWIIEEKAFINQAMVLKKLVLGICLGSQMIADILGTKVFKNQQKEIGWFPLHMNSTLKNHFIFNHVPSDIMAFHWHGDTYNLPCGSIRIAESTCTSTQGFFIEPNVIGLQFHLEVNKILIENMLSNGIEELKDPSIYIQKEPEILKGIEFIDENNSILNKLLDKFVEYNFKDK